MRLSSLNLVAGPAFEPVTLDDFKAHMRITGTDEDGTLAGWLRVGRQQVENILSRKLVSQTWILFLPQFPARNYIRLPFGNLQSVNAVLYRTLADDTVKRFENYRASNLQYDADGAESLFMQDRPGRVVLRDGYTWPTDTLVETNGVSVDFTCGWLAAEDSSASENLPEEIRLAIKILAGHFYENRELAAEKPLSIIPNTVDALLASYRIIPV